MVKKNLVKAMVGITSVLAIGAGVFYFTRDTEMAQIEDSEAKYETTYKVRPQDNSTPLNHLAEDNIYFTLDTLMKTDAYSTITTGEALAAGFTQDIYTEKVVIYDEIMTSTVSSGVLKTATLKYFPDSTKCLLGKSKKINKLDVTWDYQSEPEVISASTYKKRYGLMPRGANGYIICADTILSCETIDNQNGTYTIVMDLNPEDDYAPFWYRREVLTNAESAKVPKFSKIHIEMTIDENWRLLYTDTQEKYEVTSMGIDATSTTKVHEEYSYENVAFDQEAYDYFSKYKHIVPSDSEPDTPKEDDILTIITSAFIKSDGTSQAFDLKLESKDSQMIGLISLDLSDLNAIKVKLKLEDIYLEYSDQIYLSVGGMKVKTSINDITDLISMFAKPKEAEEDSSGQALDVASIISDLNSGEKTVEGYNVYIKSKLNLLGLEIPLNFHFVKSPTGYELLTASTELSINDISLKLDLAKSDKQIEEVNKNEFDNLNNIKFITDSVVNILTNKKLEANLYGEFNEFKFEANAKVDFNDKILLDVTLNLKYQTLDETINVKYINDTIYLSYGNLNLKITTDDLFKILDKYGANLDLDTNIDININQIIEIVFKLDYAQLLKEFKLNDDSLDITVGLGEFIEGMNDLTLKLRENGNLDLSLIYDNILLDLSINDEFTGDVTVNDEQYENLAYIQFVIDKALTIFEGKKIDLDLSLTYEDLNISILGGIDFESSLKLNAYLTLANATSSQSLHVTFIDDTIYLEFANIKIKSTIDDILSLVSKFVEIPKMEEISIESLLDTILEIDFKSLVDSIKLTENQVEVGLNLKQFAEDMDKLLISLKNIDNGLGFNVSLFDIKGSVISNPDLLIEVTGEYYNLSNINYIVDDVLAIIDSKKVYAELSGSYNGINLSGIAYVDFTNDIKLRVDLNIKYNNLELPLSVYYYKNVNLDGTLYNDVIMLDFKSVNAFITLEDIKSLIPTSTIENENVNVNDLLNTILSLDFASLIENLKLTEGDTIIDINLEQFNIDLAELVDLTKTISITISDTEDGINIDIPQLFNLSLSVGVYEGEVEVLGNNYVDLAYLFDNVGYLLSIIGKESINVTLNGSVDVSGILGEEDIDLNTTFNANIDLVLVDGKYNLEGHIYLELMDMKVDVIFKLIEDDIYLELGNIKVNLKLSEIEDLIAEITAKFKTNDEVVLTSSEENTDNSAIMNTLDTIKLGSDYLEINLSEFIETITKLTIKFNRLFDDQNNQNGINVNISSDTLINLDLTLAKSTLSEVIASNCEYITSDDILALCDNIIAVKDMLVDSNEFYLDLNMALIKNGNINLEIIGSLQIYIHDNNKFDLELNGIINEYNIDGTINRTHNVRIILVSKEGQALQAGLDPILDSVNYEDMLYLSYGNNPSDPQSSINLYLPINSVLSLTDTIGELLGIDLSFLGDIFDGGSLDINNITSLIPTGDKDSNEEKEIFDINSLVNSLTLTSTGLEILINPKIINELIPDTEALSVNINVYKDQYEKLVLQAKNIYTSYTSDDLNTKLDLNQLRLLNKEVSIKSPDTTNWYDISNVHRLVDSVLEIIESKKVYAELSGSYNGIDLSGIAYVDFTNDIKLRVDLNINYNNLELPLSVYYYKTVNLDGTLYNDVIMLDFKSVHALITLEDIKSLIPTSTLESGNVNVDDLLNTILSSDFNKLIENLKITEDGTDIDINLEQFNIDLGELVDLTKTISIAISENENGITIDIPTLFNLSVSVGVYEGEVEVLGNNYVDLAYLASNVGYLLELINKESISIKLDGFVDVSGILNEENLNIKALLEANIDLVLVDEKYNLEGHIYLEIMDMKVDVTFKLIEDDIYLIIGNISINLKLSEIEDLIAEITAKFETNDEVVLTSTEENTDNTAIMNTLDTIKLGSDYLEINISEFIETITKLTIKFNRLFDDQNNQNGINVNISSDTLINLDIILCKSTKTEVIKDELTYITADDILALCDNIIAVKDMLVNSDDFYFDLSLAVLDNGKVHLEISGILELHIYENLKFDTELNGSIYEYNKDGTVKACHNVRIILMSKEGLAAQAGLDPIEGASQFESDMLYLTYGNNPDDLSSTVNLYLPLNSLFTMTDTIGKVLNMDLSIINDIFDGEGLNINNITSLIPTGDKDSNEVKEIFDINSLVNSLSITQTGLNISINPKVINENIPQEESFDITLDVYPGEYEKLKLSAKNIYTSYESAKVNTRLDFNHLRLLDEAVSIKSPDTTNWYDISQLDRLVEGLLTTIEFKSFQIKGTVTLKAISILTIDVPIEADLVVSEDNIIEAYVHLDLSDIGLLYQMLVSKKHIYIYYSNGLIYINRVDNNGDQYQTMITIKTFMDNIMYYLLDYSMGLPDSIIDMINQTEVDPNYIADAGKCITNYNVNGDSFNVGLDMGVITGNTNLQDLSATINLKDVVTKEENGIIETDKMISSITDFSFNMVSVIELTTKELKLENLVTGADGYNRIMPITINGYSVSDYCKQYTASVESLGHILDVQYKNNSFDGYANHTIIFDLNNEYFLEDETIYSYTGPYNSLYQIPTNLPTKFTDSFGDTYKISGWYTDKDCENIFDSKVIPSESIRLYARWEKVKTLTIYNQYGDNLVVSMFEGESLQSLYESFNATSVDGKTYKFMGFAYDQAGNEMLTGDEVMPNSDLTLYVIWAPIEYVLVLDNQTNYKLNMDNNTTPAILNGNYEININNYFYGYQSNVLTEQFIISNLGKYAVYEDAYAYIHMNTYEKLTNYYQVSFDYNYSLFNNKPYVSIQVPNGGSLTGDMLPQGKYETYNINYWYDSNSNDYHAGNIKNICVDTTLYAYYATCDYLVYSLLGNDLALSGFTYEGNAIRLILPKYVYHNGEYKVPTKIAISQDSDGNATSPFYSGGESTKSNISEVYLNEGITSLESNVFKNVISLTNVYFPTTITSVAEDAFYVAKGGSYESNRDIAINFRFYLHQSSSIPTSKCWLACKWNLTKRYYGEKYSIIGSGNFQSAFQRYTNTIQEIVHNLF